MGESAQCVVELRVRRVRRVQRVCGGCRGCAVSEEHRMYTGWGGDGAEEAICIASVAIHLDLPELSPRNRLAQQTCDCGGGQPKGGLTCCCCMCLMF